MKILIRNKASSLCPTCASFNRLVLAFSDFVRLTWDIQ